MGFIGEFDDWQSFFAFITSIIFSLSPLFTIISIIKGYRSHKDVSFCTYFCMFLNSAIWFIRSLFLILKDDGKIQEVHPMDYSNLIGTCLCYIWCVILIYYKHKSNLLVMTAFLLVFTISMIVWAVIESYLVKKDIPIIDLFFKILGSIVNVLMYLSPGLNVIYMFDKYKPEFIRIEGAFFGCLNSLLWLLWAIHSDQTHSLIANVIGLLLCVVQVIYFLYAFRQSVKKSETIKLTSLLDDGLKGKNDDNKEKKDDEIKVEKTEADKLNDSIDNYI